MKKPEWLRIKKTGIYDSNIATEKLIHKHQLNTVCENAQCPNKGECFNNSTATFMILGNICTRNCTFCAVKKEPSLIKQPDPQEPERIAGAVNELNLDYVVLTMVTRDDLPDGGAGHLIDTVNTIRLLSKRPGSQNRTESIPVEVLISDMQGNIPLIEKILEALPSVFNHNIETIARLYPKVRPQADYQRSLSILAHANRYSPDIPLKSGFMVGLGETEDEVVSLIRDLRSQNVSILTIGQYLAPSSKHIPVKEYVTPGMFEKYRRIALEEGFKVCCSGPFVRSSYQAKEAWQEIKKVQGKVSARSKEKQADSPSPFRINQVQDTAHKGKEVCC